MLLLSEGVKNIDPSAYPDKSFQLSWLRTYLETLAEQDGRLPSDVTDLDVERLYVSVSKHGLVNEFYLLNLQ